MAKVELIVICLYGNKNINRNMVKVKIIVIRLYGNKNINRNMAKVKIIVIRLYRNKNLLSMTSRTSYIEHSHTIIVFKTQHKDPDVNDLAILKLKKAVKFNKYVQPVGGLAGM